MKFYSTNRQAPDVDLATALLKGQAPDRGLYMPEDIPVLDLNKLAAFKNENYAELAAWVLSHYTEGIFDEVLLRELCADAYDYEVPLEHVLQRRYIMRLDHGPTCSFKDFAARMMARWFSQLMQDRHQELVILTATSGDTGSAIAHAFYGLPNIQVMVLFPPNEVSNRQRKQMTTLGGNITLVGVDGKFDDCQALVKRAFADSDLQSIPLTSANSINIGRLLPQSVYYIYAYVQLAKTVGEPITICVPSGNFGNMMGALLAKSMGLPVQKIVIATNANDEVPEFLKTSVYRKIVPSRNCISNAMNVGHPSNLARVVALFGGHMDETGQIHQMPDMDTVRQTLWGISISDEETRETIQEAWNSCQLLLEPHGAVGWAGLNHYVKEEKAEGLMVCVETAHPAKFPEEIERLLGLEPDVPDSLKAIEGRDESYLNMAADFGVFKELLQERYGK